MRAKRIGGGRAKLRQLPPQPSAMASRYLRQPTDYEAHPDCSHVEILVNEEANNDGQHSTVPDNSSGDDPDRRCPELAPNTIGETVVVAEESCAPQAINEPKDCLEMDWTEKEVCIKCDKGGRLLVCCDRNCPLAIHEECMHFLAQFDSMGNFYCPYCSYKRAMLETRKARKRAMLAKKALSVFLDKEMVTGDSHKKKAVRVRWKEPNPSAVVADTVCDTTRNRLDGDEVDNHPVQMEEDQCEERFDPECTTIICLCKGAKPLALNLQNDALSSCGDNARPDDSGQHTTVIEQHMHPSPIIACGGSGRASCSREEDTGHRFEILQVDKSVQAEHPELVDDHRNERVLPDEEQAEPLSDSLVQKERKLDGALPISTQGELDNSGIFKEHVGRRPEEEAMQDQVQGTTLSSSGGDSMQQEHAKDSDSSHGGSGDVSPSWRHIIKKSQIGVRSPNVDCPRQSAMESLELNSNVVQKATKYPTTKSRQRITSPNVPHARRKKLPWTVEEEEMLKEGVQKFSTVVNKNLPWRKILEFGHHVFDGTRTPVDLKDKWRNILVKEC